MESLQETGIYHITKEMKEQLESYSGGFASEEETAEMIKSLYEKTGYVIDTHTAVAASVCEKYQKESGDAHKTVIASTASPYKFSRSVMTAIDPRYEELDEFDLVDALEVISNVEIPNAVEEIRDAKILHTLECDADKMEETVKNILKG